MAICGNKAKGLLTQLGQLKQQARLQFGAIATTSVKAQPPADNVTKQPCVLATHGKWVKVEGQAKALVDFTSLDIFGVQNHPLVDRAGDATNPLHSNNSHHPALARTRTHGPQSHLKETLAQLHGKDDVIVTSQSLEHVLTSWVRHLNQKQNGGVKVHLHSDCGLLAGFQSDAVVNRYSDLTDLEQRLKTCKEENGSRLNLVFVEADATQASIEHLKELCYVAEKQYACVVLLDPQGIGLMRHATENKEWIARALRRPSIILSGLGVLGGHQSGCYVTGSRAGVTQLRHSIADDEQCLDDKTARRIIKCLHLLPTQESVLLRALMHSLSLRVQLERACVQVREAGLALRVRIEQGEHVACRVCQALLKKGFLVSVKETPDQLHELEFTVSGHLSGDDVMNFRIALLQELDKCDVIENANAFTQLPKISLATMNVKSGAIHESVSYKNIIKAERAHMKSVTKPRDSDFISLRNKVSIVPESRIKHEKDIKKSNETWKTADLRFLSEVYCWAENETSESNTSIFDNVLWASPQVNSGDSQESIEDQNQEVIKQKHENKRKFIGGIEGQPSDLKYLENLYCTPMYQDKIAAESSSIRA